MRIASYQKGNFRQKNKFELVFSKNESKTKFGATANSTNQNTLEKVFNAAKIIISVKSLPQVFLNSFHYFKPVSILKLAMKKCFSQGKFLSLLFALK